MVNTSFNIRGEPIVCTPQDALFCLGHSGLDGLVLEDYVIDRSHLPAHWEQLLSHWQRVRRSSMRSSVSEHLYTFV